MTKIIFEYTNYRTYLRTRLEVAGGRGCKALLAKAIAVQPTYVSQVLQERAHLSLEQAEAANLYFMHNTQESHFFLLLVQKDRAGTKTLREYFKKQMDAVLKERLVLTERLGKTQQLEEADRSWYYGSWLPAAIHIATTIPTLRTVNRLSEALLISPEKTLEILEHLEVIGLIKKEGAEYYPGTQVIRIGKDSQQLLKHHTNWRLQAMQSFDREKINELHYSGVVSLSSADVTKIKDRLLGSIKDNIDLIKDSKEEELFCLTIDFFNLIRK